MGLKQLAAVLEQAALLVTGDTGVLHLGAAMGCPAVILAGPTDPRLVYCESCRQAVLFDREACPEWTEGEQCPRHNHCSRRECLDAIAVEAVEGAVSELLVR
jgi:ADP-heptose:LPS heptosyltransferase